MEEKNNAKCPYCGKEFSLRLTKGECVCTGCKKQFDADKAVKLYESIYGEQEKSEKKAATGEDYLEVDRLLERAEYYLKRNEFENAEKELNDALKITTSDFRVYFGFVRAETKNLTDVKNKSHREYLDKAIDCADSDGKVVITRLYKDFFQKSKLTDEELAQYETEENAAKKEKLEKRLKDLIPEYMKKESGLKKFLIMFPIFLALGLAASITGIIVELNIVMVGGVALMALGYVFLRSYINGRKSVNAFNALLDLFDVLDSFDFNTETKRGILDQMKETAKLFGERGSLYSIEDHLTRLADELNSTSSAAACDFIAHNKTFSKYLKPL